MIIWYIFSTILIAAGVVALIWGAIELCRGALQKDIEIFLYGVLRVICAGLIALIFWIANLVFGLDLGWIKTFVVENTGVLKIMAVVLVPPLGAMLIMTCLFLIRWFLLDPINSKNKTSSEDEEEREDNKEGKE